jgi:hypothetical protein
MLSNEQITKYQALYKNRYGRKICREEAHEQAAKLIRLVELVYKPMTKEDYKQFKKKLNKENKT